MVLDTNISQKLFETRKNEILIKKSESVDFYLKIIENLLLKGFFSIKLFALSNSLKKAVKLARASNKLSPIKFFNLREQTGIVKSKNRVYPHKTSNHVKSAY